MSKLKRLAKLKQYDRKTEVREYLFKEHRQNIMAIESAFNEASQYLFANIGFNAVPHNEALTVTFSDPVDPSNLINKNNIILANDGIYLFDFTFNGLTARDFQTLTLHCFVNQEEVKTIRVISNNDLLALTICARASFYLPLMRTDSIYFILSSTESGGSIEFTDWSSAMLKMEQF